MSQFMVTDKDGNPVNKGDEILDFRGDPWIFRQVTQGSMPGRSAKVYVTHGDASREFYAVVFNLTVTDAGDDEPKRCSERTRFGMCKIQLDSDGNCPRATEHEA